MADLTHIQRIRQAMPVTSTHVYLNTGTFGPLPVCVIEAIQERIQFEYQNGRLGAKAFEAMREIYESARRAVARLMHANDDEIALTDNTGEGMNIISYGFDWQEGDEIITTNHEHISALAPLYQIRDRYGVVLRIADLGPDAERPAWEAIEGVLTPRTRLVVLSHITWTTGALIDVSAVTKQCRSRGIPVLVDGAQSAGVIDIDVKALGVDFYAIPMQKWLCGPDGTGALYVSRNALHYVTPTYVGYWSIKHEESDQWEFNDGASRFELGGRQSAAISGQVAVLNWLEQVVGYPWIYNRIATLNRYAYQALGDLPGLSLLTPRPGVSGIVAFTWADHDDAEIVKRLNEEHNISIRNIPSTKALRVSTGFYNTEEDIDTLLRALRTL